jgi:hypothetical protein
LRSNPAKRSKASEAKKAKKAIKSLLCLFFASQAMRSKASVAKKQKHGGKAEYTGGVAKQFGDKCMALLSNKKAKDCFAR